MKNVYIIGEQFRLTQDLAILFFGTQWKVIYICERGMPAKNSDIIILPKVPSSTFIENLLTQTELLKSIDGLVIFGSDREMREVSESRCLDWIKKKLLPAVDAKGYGLYDSKVGFCNLGNELNIKSPQQMVVADYSKFKQAIELISGDVLIKGDKGAAGSKVIDLKKNLELPSDLDLPLVVQQKLDGVEIAVEAFFSNGKLTGYIYSNEIKVISPYGPSFKRLVTKPIEHDFVATLEVIGKELVVTGMVNASFILEHKSNEHFLIEFDMRPNVWHHLAAINGMDVDKLFSQDTESEIQVPLTSMPLISLHRYLTYLTFRPSVKKWVDFIEDIRDPQIFCIETQSHNIKARFKYMLKNIGKFSIHFVLVHLFRKLPLRIQQPFKRRKITHRLSSKILGT